MSDINIVLENRDDIHVAVEEKDINVEVPAGKDGRSLRPRGEWSASAAYAYLDLVSYQGSSYVATKAVPAGTLPTDTSYWMLSAEKGEPGTPEWGEIAGNIADQTDLQTALDNKAPVILNSASGSIASFSDGSPAPVTALSVGIEPVQSGTGDPSPTNVRPISGHTSATVTRTGKNLINIADFTNGSLNPDSGAVVSSSTRNVSAYIFLKSGTYTFSRIARSQDNWSKAVLYDTAKTYVKKIYNNQSTTNTFTLDNDGYIRIGADYIADASDHFLLELGSVSSSFEPYQGTSVTIDLDGTRYGGTLDVLTGVLTVDKVSLTFDGSEDENWNFYSASRQYAAILVSLPIKYTNSSAIPPMIGNIAKPVSQSASYSAVTYSALSANVQNKSQLRYIYAGVTDTLTLAEFKLWLGENNLQICYELEEPFTVQLTPSQLSILLGTNNIWADTGDVAVEYRADTKRFVQGQIAQTAKVTRQMIADSATADGKAPKSLATGDLIIVGDELRKATANIGNGSAITASNSTTATLADVIKALQ